MRSESRCWPVQANIKIAKSNGNGAAGNTLVYRERGRFVSKGRRIDCHMDRLAEW